MIEHFRLGYANRTLAYCVRRGIVITDSTAS
jgi:hypothetical protein